MCGLIIAKYLSLSSVIFTREFFCHYFEEGTQESLAPFLRSESFLAFSDAMTFEQRVWNLIRHMRNVYFAHIFTKMLKKLPLRFSRRLSQHLSSSVKHQFVVTK